MTTQHSHKNDEQDAHAPASGHHAKPKRPFYTRGYLPLFAFLFFAVLFALIFIVHLSAGKAEYDALNQQSLAIREFGMADAPKMMGYFTSYGFFAGLLLGIFIIPLSYIIYGLGRLWKWNGAAGLGICLTYVLFAFYGYELAYEGPGTVIWANGITAFLGVPLLWSGILIALFGIGAIAFVLRPTRSKPSSNEKGDA